MHAQTLGRSGDVAPALLEQPLNVLPLDAVEPERQLGNWRLLGCRTCQRLDEFLRDSRFGEVVGGPARTATTTVAKLACPVSTTMRMASLRARSLPISAMPQPSGMRSSITA